MSGTEKSDAQDVDVELTAIRSIMTALAGLDAAQKDRVLDYVFRRLGLSRLTAAPPASPATAPRAPVPTDPLAPSDSVVAAPIAPAVTDVRSFATAKRPASDIERVAVVAYYLAEIGVGEENKGAITSDDITKYFKQAGFPLPSRPRQTLHNTKNAGYLDAAAETGSYKLNPVGHNLVVHGLPAATTSAKLAHKKKDVKSARKALR